MILILLVLLAALAGNVWLWRRLADHDRRMDAMTRVAANDKLQIEDAFRRAQAEILASYAESRVMDRRSTDEMFGQIRRQLVDQNNLIDGQAVRHDKLASSFDEAAQAFQGDLAKLASRFHAYEIEYETNSAVIRQITADTRSEAEHTREDLRVLVAELQTLLATLETVSDLTLRRGAAHHFRLRLPDRLRMELHDTSGVTR